MWRNRAELDPASCVLILASHSTTLTLFGCDKLISRYCYNYQDPYATKNENKDKLGCE